MERNFGWLNANWESWKDRKDLFDYVITKGADFTVRFIQNVEVQMACTCCTL